MLAIENTLISDDVLEKKFVCDLDRCKGACCVAGDSGAPLENEELEILENIYDQVKPYMSTEGIKAVEEKGLYVKDIEDEFTTTLITDKECAYTLWENGIAKCSIEKAYNEGKINFKKPISCHLYPIRIKHYQDFDAVNYHEWAVCAGACELGKHRKVRVFEFVKDALIRKYGGDWFSQLQYAANTLK